MQKILAGFLLLCLAKGLHVVQILDSVILEVGEFINLSNFNEANAISQESQAFN
jgi:hypothetical protein